MNYIWNIYNLYREHMWNIYGTYIIYIESICEIYMEHIWNVFQGYWKEFGKKVWRIFLQVKVIINFLSTLHRDKLCLWSCRLHKGKLVYRNRVIGCLFQNHGRIKWCTYGRSRPTHTWLLQRGWMLFSWWQKYTFHVEFIFFFLLQSLDCEHSDPTNGWNSTAYEMYSSFNGKHIAYIFIIW